MKYSELPGIQNYPDLPYSVELNLVGRGLMSKYVPNEIPSCSEHLPEL